MLSALSLSRFRYLFGISPIEFLDAVCNEAEVVPIESFHVFERPVKSLEDRECVD